MCFEDPDGRPMSIIRFQFLRMAVTFQGALLLGAWLLGWMLEPSRAPWRRSTLSFEAVGLGIVATIPMLLFFVAIYRSKARCLVDVQQIVSELLGPPLAACKWFDLLGIALLAGISEEFLFREVLESYFSQWSPLAGLIVCNVLFGLCHALTPTYALLAALLGCYLSLTLKMTEQPNLVIPIVSHSLYDFVAFMVVRNAQGSRHLRNHEQKLPILDEQPAIHDPSNTLDPPIDG